MMRWLALDIGGANLKAADGLGFAAAEPFPLWREPDRLPCALRDLLAAAPAADRLAVTMTGELADCFESKRAGVLSILDAVASAAEGRPICVYLTTGSLVPLEAARQFPERAAASNWHALARFAGRFIRQGAGILLDVGSTTCDVVPLADGQLATSLAGDTQRLMAGELVYTGVERSPICGVVGTLPYRGVACPVAQELFATTWDAYLILEELPEAPHATRTADGRPATIACARRRLARMLCLDPADLNPSDAWKAAEAVRKAQAARIGIAMRQVARRLCRSVDTIVLAGQGEFLGRRVAERFLAAARVISLAEEIGPVASACAPAHALAVLAREGLAEAPPAAHRTP